MPNRGKELLLAAVPRKVGESVKEYLNRASKEIGLGYASTEHYWKGNFRSRRAEAKIEAKVKNNEYDLSSKTQELVEAAEAAAASAVAVGQDQRICDSLRGVVEQVRDLHRAVGEPAKGTKAMKIAIAFALATSTLVVALPSAPSSARAQIYPAQWEEGVRYPRPPGGGTRPRPRPEPRPLPPRPAPRPQPKPYGYWR